MNKVIAVTRHPALIQYFHETGLLPEGAPVMDRATARDVRGAHVIGVLPLHLMALAESVTKVPFLVPDMRGRELSIEEIRSAAGRPVTYQVRKALNPFSGALPHFCL